MLESCFSRYHGGSVVETSREKFDIVHVEHLRGAKYGLFLKESLGRFEKIKPPVVWDSVDSISYLFRQTVAKTESHINRMLTRFELQRTEKYERFLETKFDKVLVTSKIDKGSFESLGASDNKNTMVLTNGVDLEYFQPDPSVSREPATIIVSGKIKLSCKCEYGSVLVE